MRIVRKRQTSKARREHILQVMDVMYKEACSQADFTAAQVARKAEVSTVWFYHLVGSEFQELRSQLEGSRRPAETVIRTLKKQIVELRGQVRDLKIKLKTAVLEEIAEAIRMIERLDEENRSLHSEVLMLRRRLAEKGLVIVPEYLADSSYRINRRFH